MKECVEEWYKNTFLLKKKEKKKRQMATPENLKTCSLTCYHCHNFSMGPCPLPVVGRGLQGRPPKQLHQMLPCILLSGLTLCDEPCD